MSRRAGAESAQGAQFSDPQPFLDEELGLCFKPISIRKQRIWLYCTLPLDHDGQCDYQ